MLEKVKLALRYSTQRFDDELNALIDACRDDLQRVGVDGGRLYSDSPALTNVVICFCKWQLNYQNRGLEWGKLYRELRQDIALDGDYRCRQR